MKFFGGVATSLPWDTLILLLCCWYGSSGRHTADAFCSPGVSTVLRTSKTSLGMATNNEKHTIFPMTLSTSKTEEATGPSESRRYWLCGVSRTMATAAIVNIVTAQPSWAIKPRNEALCGTGLFTNFLEYRCTDLGDISDEGQKTSFSSSNDAGTADSLLSKLNLELDDSFQTTTDGEEEAKTNTRSEKIAEEKTGR